MNEPDATSPIQPPTLKQRHGCLTAYLIFMMVINSATALAYLLGSAAIRQNLPTMPGWAIPVLVVASLFNLACAIALFLWKRWGFWGFIASAIAVFCLNLAIGLGPWSAMGGLIGIAILFGVLQIGKEKKGWPQLE